MPEVLSDPEVFRVVAQLLSGLLLCYCDEYDLGLLCCVSKSLRSIAVQDALWKKHLARRSPSLAFAASANSRNLLIQLEREHPSLDIRRFLRGKHMK